MVAQLAAGGGKGRALVDDSMTRQEPEMLVWRGVIVGGVVALVAALAVSHGS